MKIIFILYGVINLVEAQNFRGAAQVGAAFRAPDDHRLGRGGTNDTKCVDCIDLDGDDHMDMIVQHMESVGYNKYHKPNPTGELEVKVNMFIDTIQAVSEAGMAYEITMFFRQFWVDPRLTWGMGAAENGTEEVQLYKRVDKSYNVAADMVDLLWLPDTFFIDEIDSRRHSIMTRNIFLEIHPNGYILLSERLTLKLKCPMHLRYYPFDLQICPIRAESYAFREDQMSYSWNDNSQIGINEQISLPTFKLKEYLVRPECTRTFSTGNFSCFEGYLLLTRRISYYLIHIFFPSTLCVIVSWTAFWIKLDSAPARVTCGILTFLAIQSWTHSVNAELAKVSYIKAIDVWTVSCNIFVFLSLMQYAFAQVFLRMKQNDIDRRRSSGQLHADSSEVMHWKSIGSGQQGIWVDKVSRRLFPLLFTFFNILYWSICCGVSYEEYPEGTEVYPVELIDSY